METMPVMGGSKNRDVFATIYEALALIFIGYFTPQLIAFAAKGYDTQSVINQANIYQGLLIGGLLAIILCWVIEKFLLKGDNLYGSSILFSSQGEFPSIESFKKFRSIQLTHLSLVFFGAIFGFAWILRTGTLTGVTKLEQQFTPAANFLFSSFLVAASENIFWMAILVIILTLFIRPLARKQNWSSGNFRGLTAILFIIGGAVLGVLLHLFRYRSSDISIGTVAIFWGIGGLLTFIVGSAIPFLVMHFFNNTMLDINGIFSNDTVVILIFGIYLVILISYLIIWRGQLFGDRVRTI